MNKDKQRIALAEFEGIKSICVRCGHEQLCTELTCQECGSFYIEVRKNIPDYLNDLNAMHGVERLIPEDKQYGYCQWLMKIQAPHRSTEYMENTWLSTTATAPQRAEALLRTIGKWTDD